MRNKLMGLELISFTWKGQAKKLKKMLQNYTKLTLNTNSIQFKDFFVLQKN